MFKRYGSGIVDIIFGNATAKEAVEKCEKATEDEMRSLLSELMEGEGGSEFGEMLAKLAERLGMPRRAMMNPPTQAVYLQRSKPTCSARKEMMTDEYHDQNQQWDLSCSD